MSDKTAIEWTDATWNPIRGCSRVSEGCRHCYAENVAGRFSAGGQPYEGLAKRDAAGNRRWTGDVRLISHALETPLRWRKPRRIFVNSMNIRKAAYQPKRSRHWKPCQDGRGV